MSDSPPRVSRLDYLDGLRAAAALYVVAFHAVPGFAAEGLTGGARALLRIFAFGHEAVAIFIVLSGYCLMLPVARTSDGRMRRSLSAYIARRAFRILPPYYVAMAGSLALIAGVDALARPGSGTIWDDSLPGLSPGAIASHLLVVHNWFPTWAYQINGPFWSVATEWQIYFFFPLLLLPVWRRHGLVALCVVSIVVGYAPLLWVPERAMVAIPWYLALFAFGMVAALLGVSPDPSVQRLRERVSWRAVSVALWGGCLLFGMGAAKLWFSLKPATDLLVGLATACLLVYLTEEAVSDARAPGPLLRLLQSRPFTRLGDFSYSLYLTHLPVLALLHVSLKPLGLPPPAYALTLLVSGCVASVVVAYGFFLTVERFFLRPPDRFAAYFDGPALQSRVQAARSSVASMPGSEE